MNILFCNIAWMKYYEGANENDKPINGGSYIAENQDGAEGFNFQDYNGYCYGFVRINGNMALEQHFEGIEKNHPFVENVLVIWVATNEDKKTRIIGWYKNATIFREEQFEEAFTNQSHNLFYRIKALAKDCYLIPEEKRDFEILRASETGTGMGMGRSNIWYAESQFAQNILIPQVLKYIENYSGEYVNRIYTDDVLNKTIDTDNSRIDFIELYNKGIESYKRQNFLEGLRYLNTASIIQETPDVLFYIADGLLNLNCIDKAITYLEKVIELEGEKIDTLNSLIIAYDHKRNRDKTLEYCSKILPLLGESKEDVKDKIFFNYVMFRIYISLMDKENARESINKISLYSNDEDDKKLVKDLQKFMQEEFCY